jgi:GDP-mannose 6-dehydrogenase
VGVVGAACLAREGHYVVGVDSVQSKADMINQGLAPIVEPGLGEQIHRVFQKGFLRATTKAEEAIYETELSLVCVGTPSQLNGNLDLSHLRRVCEQIGGILQNKRTFHVVAIRSTILPGTMRTVVIPTLEEYSGKKAGKDFGVCYNPEFLREGSAIFDFDQPPQTIIGGTDSRSSDLLAVIYENLPAPIIRTTLEIAEMIKYTSNAWHALKICFANEIGTLCKEVGIDGHELMEVFCRDTKLNVSPAYLKPGFAFGGSCLPKDVRALAYKGRSLDLNLPMINSILTSNESQIERGLRLILSKGHKRISILGFSFKAETDDLRESPLVEVIERLLGKGYELRLFDRNVKIASLKGANRYYIMNTIPHISKLMVESLDEALAHAQTVVIGNNDPEFKTVPLRLRPDQTIVDLVRIESSLRTDQRYDGICW